MSKAQVIYWRDIPTQVIVGKGRNAVKRQLAERFMVAVDKAAKAAGAEAFDDYLDDWRRLDTEAAEGDPEAAADALASELESDYPAQRLADLARHGGKEFLQ